MNETEQALLEGYVAAMGPMSPNQLRCMKAMAREQALRDIKQPPVAATRRPVKEKEPRLVEVEVARTSRLGISLFGKTFKTTRELQLVWDHDWRLMDLNPFFDSLFLDEGSIRIPIPAGMPFRVSRLYASELCYIHADVELLSDAIFERKSIVSEEEDGGFIARSMQDVLRDGAWHKRLQQLISADQKESQFATNGIVCQDWATLFSLPHISFTRSRATLETVFNTLNAEPNRKRCINIS